jgi:glycine oxidase
MATAASRRGARFLEGTWAVALEAVGGRATGVVTPSGVVRGETIVLAAGVWSADLARLAGVHVPVAPVKGQVISLRGLERSPRQVIWSGESYLMPRPDGEVLLGSTEEEGNYDARPTLAGVNRLTEAALEVLPAAGGFVVEGVWAGLRPAAPDRRPIVGWAPGLERLMIATAHYRNGVLLGPLTGRRVAEQILIGGEMAANEFGPFGPGRFVAQGD